MNSALFVVAAVSLLVTPGPTNTLLATSGASAGVRRSAHLLVAELGGYLLAIALLRALLGPMIAATPMLGELLRMAATIYLTWPSRSGITGISKHMKMRLSISFAFS